MRALVNAATNSLIALRTLVSAGIHRYAERRNCDPRFRLSQITWRMSVAHHPTEDIVRSRETDKRLTGGSRFRCLRLL